MNKWLLPLAGGAFALALTAAACGDSSESPMQPTPQPPTGNPAPATLTITVRATGATLSGSEVAANGTITVVNEADDSHTMSSNPHPDHTDCPALNFGKLEKGQSKTTNAGALAGLAGRTCGMHDHEQPGTQSLRPTITIR